MNEAALTVHLARSPVAKVDVTELAPRLVFCPDVQTKPVLDSIHKVASILRTISVDLVAIAWPLVHLPFAAVSANLISIDLNTEAMSSHNQASFMWFFHFGQISYDQIITSRFSFKACNFLSLIVVDCLFRQVLNDLAVVEWSVSQLQWLKMPFVDSVAAISLPLDNFFNFDLCNDNLLECIADIALVARFWRTLDFGDFAGLFLSSSPLIQSRPLFQRSKKIQ